MASLITHFFFLMSTFRAQNSNTNDIVALKFQKPPNLWELYICTEVDKRIKTAELVKFEFGHSMQDICLTVLRHFPISFQMLGFMDISSAVVAPNASIFVSEFSQYGSLLDINNRIRQATTKVDH